MKHTVALLILAFALSYPSRGQERPLFDNSGKGAVICMFDIYTTVKATTEVCQWERIPFDDVLDQSILDMEVFIRANATDPRTIETMNRLKHRYDDASPIPAEELAKICTDFDKEDRTSSMAFIWMLRQSDAAAFAAGMRDSLSLPREPLYNPCL